MKLRNALLAATVLVAPIAVHAQAIDGLYIGAGAGANLLQDENVRSHNVPTNFARGSNYRFSVGPVVVASVGYGLAGLFPGSALSGFRFELQGAGYDNKVNKLKNGGASVFGTNTRNTSAGGDEYKYGVFLNALYDVPLAQFGVNSPVFPYVGVGVGYVHDKMNNGHVSSVNVSNSTSAQFLRDTGQNDNLGVQGIVGVSFPIYDYVPGLAFTAEYRFMSEIGGRSFNEQYFAGRAVTGTKQKFATDDFNHSILLGVRYAFNVPTPPPPPVVVPVPAQVPARTYLVFFDWDRADLTDRARQIVTEAAQASTRVQYTRIEVQGNADRSGTPAYNQRLSLRRAQTVAAELVRDGVPRTAIDIQAFGDTRPLVPTAAGVREPQNRRVAIILR
jgi:OOP family OmpA-OmpF porin